MRTFRTAEVAVLSGINQATLNEWVASGFVTPSVAAPTGRGTRRLWNWNDLLCLRTAAELRAAGLSMQRLRAAVDYLRKEGYQCPLSDLYLIVAGDDVVAVDGDDVISVLKEPGQKLLRQVLDLGLVCQELEEAVHMLDKPSPAKGGGKGKKAS